MRASGLLTEQPGTQPPARHSTPAESTSLRRRMKPTHVWLPVCAAHPPVMQVTVCPGSQSLPIRGYPTVVSAAVPA